MANVPLQSLLDQARRALETGAADQAVGIAQHILHHAPDTIEAHRLLAEAYLNGNQPQEAVAAFQDVLRADPESIAAYYGLGLAQQTLGQRAEAIASYERALEIQPNLTELREQLMRLYAETPGSAGQFRLSRPGLGRLYARGQMYSQAIDEFRAVLDSEPNRDDVRVALAEALWRDGQEDEAADWCRDSLEYQASLHKPTVLLGYLQLAAGQPEGEILWRRAAAQDPTLTMARSLFDILPPVKTEEQQLPSFDVQAWQQAQAAARPAPAAPTAGGFGDGGDDDFFNDSWLGNAAPAANAVGAAPAQTTQAAPSRTTPPPAADDDNLLASLLGMDEAPTPAAPVAQDEPVQPFSFDDWNLADDSQPAAVASAPADFSLDDLGVEDSVAPFSLEDEAPTAGQVRPFSFDDEPAAPAAPTGGVQPFSFDDDDDGVQPFSFDDDSAPAGGVQPFSFEDDPGSGGVQPFSFDDDPAPAGGVQPFSMGDFEMGDGSGSIQPFSFDDFQSGEGEDPALQPFSLDDLAPDSVGNVADQSLSGPQGEDELAVEDAPSFSWTAPRWQTQAPPQQPQEEDVDGSIFSKMLKTRQSDPTPHPAPDPIGPGETDDNFFSMDDIELRDAMS